MDRREFVLLSAFSVTILGFSASKALAFSLPKIGGGGGGDWGSIVKNFKGGLVELSTQSGVVGEVIADLAEALGLKQEAAIMRGEAKSISEKGDALGADDLDSFNAKSGSTLALVNEKLAAGVKLDAEQKKKMAEAGAKYVPALFKGVKAASQLSSVGSDASGAGAPGITDGMDAFQAAIDIPVLVPKAISFVTNSVSAGQKLTAIMRENDIAVPDTSGLASAMAGM